MFGLALTSLVFWLSYKLLISKRPPDEVTGSDEGSRDSIGRCFSLSFLRSLFMRPTDSSSSLVDEIPGSWIDMSDSESLMASPESSTVQCDGCSSDVTPESTVQCPGCSDSYCSLQCLEDVAHIHARYCENPQSQLTTAHTLMLAAYADMFPDDPQTNEDYFFTRARTTHDKTHLFGLYIGVLKILGMKPSTLHQWRISGTMVENIKALYADIPPGARGGYYAWFIKNLDIFEPRPSALISLSPRHICASRGVSASVRCVVCKKVWYCSKSCQQKEWPGHLVDCHPGRPITSADRLRAAAHRKTVPLDQETRSNYGFTRVDEVGGRVLLDVYRVVFEEGFITHRYALDPTIPVPEPGESITRQIERAIGRLWNTVGDFPSQDHDEIKAAIRNWPTERADFFLFRSLFGLSQCHPGPNLDSWIPFGFCACHDEDEERFLMTTYQILVERSSYEEFFTAYNTSSITELLDAKGLRARRMALPYLEDVLSGSPHSFKSVWYLKQHVQDLNTVHSDMQLSVETDYGFMNCTSEEEYQDLRALYTTIFERLDANPLKLHEACVSGSLFDYVAGCIPELKKKKNKAKKLKRLLRNMYPLVPLDSGE
ncbi:hypothetical protein DFH06DRAFT_1417347 [Mycena polygramma]|nr:hypothetical protein DFH06DRAFT_1417347 [Mycena polygramma]